MKTVNTLIRINGVEDPIVADHILIHSPYNSHHKFEIGVPLSQMDSAGISDIKAMLGEKISIKIQSVADRDQQCHFIGVVDEICPVWTSRGRSLIIKGFSPTILLDTVPVFRTVKKESLSQFVRKITQNRIPDLEIQNSNDVIDWKIQPQQTDYQMLLSVADEYNKICAYDGTKLIFGDLGLNSADEITLVQETDLQSLRLSLNLCPLEFQVTGYDPISNKNIPPVGSDSLASKNPLVTAAIEKSDIYPKVDIFLSESVKNQQELERHARRIQTRQTHELVVLNGQSSNPAIKIGSIILIDTDDDLLQGAFEGRYLVLQVDHQLSNGIYTNSWVAVPLDHPYPIRMLNARNPVCGSRLAMVKEADDAEYGLLKVSFIGDPEENVSPGIPVVTAFTSHGGAFILPQPGELVVVAFENFNPDKPLIYGSLFFGGKNAERWKKKKRGFAIGDAVFEVDENGKLTITADEIELVSRKLMELRSDCRINIKGSPLHLNPMD